MRVSVARGTKDAELLYILWAHLACLKKICSRPHSAISADGLCEFLRTVIGFVANTTLARAMSSAAGDHCCGLAWRRARTLKEKVRYDGVFRPCV